MLQTLVLLFGRHDLPDTSIAAAHALLHMLNHGKYTLSFRRMSSHESFYSLENAVRTLDSDTLNDVIRIALREGR